MAGCGRDGETVSAGDRVERCVERFVERTQPRAEIGEDALRGYVERAYCRPFSERGWVQEDGSLTIDVVTAGASDHVCAEAEGEGPAKTVPCDEMREGAEPLDCALLHLVRRSEVEEYMRALEEPVVCDDGTPVDELGVAD